MRELFWSLGWIRPVTGSERTAANAEEPTRDERANEALRVSEAPEPSTWIAVLEAHAALGHGAMPRRFVTSSRIVEVSGTRSPQTLRVRDATDGKS
jgi:hypothetical protein